jgi:hypothetical protein
MTTPTVTETRRHGYQIGERVQLARYTISSGARVVLGQRVDGVVRVIDRPVSGRGRSYLVERGLEQDGNAALQTLVAHYVQQARTRDRVPMETSAISSELQQLDAGEQER